MRNVIQVTAVVPNMDGVELWFDVMEDLPGINDTSGLLEAVRKDFPGRRVRIVQILEEPRS